jgi:putative nucleotidyltransferase with HDIG domain
MNAGRQPSVPDWKALSVRLERDGDVRAMLGAIARYDPLTEAHSLATGAWSAQIARKLGLDHAAQEYARLCGTLHDVGKMEVPSEILLKPGKLTPHEWTLMRAHSEIGARMLSEVSSLAEVAHVVLSHHERIDGKGYPHGLRGDEIPFMSRLVAVADSFHAMVGPRPYRRSLTRDEAIDELQAGAGTQWDADVVGALISVVRPNGKRVARKASIAG